MNSADLNGSRRPVAQRTNLQTYTRLQHASLCYSHVQGRRSFHKPKARKPRARPTAHQQPMKAGSCRHIRGSSGNLPPGSNQLPNEMRSAASGGHRECHSRLCGGRSRWCLLQPLRLEKFSKPHGSIAPYDLFWLQQPGNEPVNGSKPLRPTCAVQVMPSNKRIEEQAVV